MLLAPPAAAPVVVCDEVNEEDAVHQVDKVDEVHQVHQVDLAHQVNKVDEVHQVHPLDPVHHIGQVCYVSICVLYLLFFVSTVYNFIFNYLFYILPIFID